MTTPLQTYRWSLETQMRLIRGTCINFGDQESNQLHCSLNEEDEQKHPLPNMCHIPLRWAVMHCDNMLFLPSLIFTKARNSAKSCISLVQPQNRSLMLTIKL